MRIIIMPFGFLILKIFFNYYCAFAYEKFLMPIVIGVPMLIDFMKNSHDYDYWGAYTAVEMVEFCELFNYQWGIWHSTCASIHNFGMLIEKLVRQLGRNNASDVWKVWTMLPKFQTWFSNHCSQLWKLGTIFFKQFEDWHRKLVHQNKVL